MTPPGLLDKSAGFLAVVATVLFLFTSPGVAENPPQLDHYLVEVDGMACAFCARGLERKLGDIDEAGEPEFDLEDGEVVIPVDRGEDLTPSTIEEVVVDSGYAVRGLHVAGTAQIVESDDRWWVMFSRDLRLPAYDYGGDEGRFDIEGRLHQRGDHWFVEITSRE